MKTVIEWDPCKAEQNQRKHKVPFEEASTVFADPLSSTIPDPLHSEKEERFIIIGKSVRGRVLIVVHTDEIDKIRIISARHARSYERRAYEKGIEVKNGL
jgi:hypothetical protein